MSAAQSDLFAPPAPAEKPFRLMVNGYDVTERMPLTVAMLEQLRSRRDATNLQQKHLTGADLGDPQSN